MCDIFSEENAQKSNSWFAFKNPGDRIAGVVTDIFEVPARGKYPAQKGFALRIEDGSVINVGVKKTLYNMDATKGVALGDTLGVLFEKTIPSKEAGNHDAKSMKFYVRKTPCPF